MKKNFEEIQEVLSEIFSLTEEEKQRLEEYMEYEQDFGEDVKKYKTYKPKKMDE